MCFSLISSLRVSSTESSRSFNFILTLSVIKWLLGCNILILSISLCLFCSKWTFFNCFLMSHWTISSLANWNLFSFLIQSMVYCGSTLTSSLFSSEYWSNIPSIGLKCALSASLDSSASSLSCETGLRYPDSFTLSSLSCEPDYTDPIIPFL